MQPYMMLTQALSLLVRSTGRPSAMAPAESSTAQAIHDADLLIVAGTSLTVYPAAGMIHYYRGRRLVLINRDATPMDSMADLVIHDKVGDVLGAVHIEPLGGE